jgi:hypothetical protein
MSLRVGNPTSALVHFEKPMPMVIDPLAVADEPRHSTTASSVNGAIEGIAAPKIQSFVFRFSFSCALRSILKPRIFCATRTHSSLTISMSPRNSSAGFSHGTSAPSPRFRYPLTETTGLASDIKGPTQMGYSLESTSWIPSASGAISANR